MHAFTELCQCKRLSQSFLQLCVAVPKARSVMFAIIPHSHIELFQVNAEIRFIPGFIFCSFHSLENPGKCEIFLSTRVCAFSFLRFFISTHLSLSILFISLSLSPLSFLSFALHFWILKFNEWVHWWRQFCAASFVATQFEIIARLLSPILQSLSFANCFFCHWPKSSSAKQMPFNFLLLET